MVLSSSAESVLVYALAFSSCWESAAFSAAALAYLLCLWGVADQE
jgi:hypothetical protein